MMSDFRKQNNLRTSRVFNNTLASLKDQKVLGYKQPLDEVYADLHEDKYFYQTFVGQRDYARKYPVPLTMYGVLRGQGKPGLKPIEIEINRNVQQPEQYSFLREVLEYEEGQDKNLQAYIHSSLGQTALREVPLPRGLFAALEVQNTQRGKHKEAVLFVPKSVIYSIKPINESLQNLAQMRGSNSDRLQQTNFDFEKLEVVASKLALSAIYNAFRPKLV